MKVRSITAFAPKGIPVEEAALTAGGFLGRARDALEASGTEVQTVRLAFPALRELVEAEATDGDLVDLARRTEQACAAGGVDYVSLGPWQPGDPEEHARALTAILSVSSKLFVTLQIADREDGIDPHAARLAADTIVEAAPLEPDGFANLRFSALANVGPGVPFLPAAWSDGEGWAFALALESADLAREAFADCTDLESGAAGLTRSLEEAGSALVEVVRGLRTPDFRFHGLDFSFAPFPEDSASVGATLESMGVQVAGLPGTTTAAAILTTALSRARIPLTGFSGLFLPVLEDDRLAARAATGDLRLEDLLLASSVCGTGLDTVPLPGDASADDLLPWLLDLAALSVRLDKPLTARLMPMPGCEAGDPLEFDFPFFASGAVMELPRTRWTGTTVAGGRLPVRPRQR